MYYNDIVFLTHAYTNVIFPEHKTYVNIVHILIKHKCCVNISVVKRKMIVKVNKLSFFLMISFWALNVVFDILNQISKETSKIKCSLNDNSSWPVAHEYSIFYSIIQYLFHVTVFIP